MKCKYDFKRSLLFPCPSVFLLVLYFITYWPAQEKSTSFFHNNLATSRFITPSLLEALSRNNPVPIFIFLSSLLFDNGVIFQNVLAPYKGACQSFGWKRKCMYSTQYLTHIQTILSHYVHLERKKSINDIFWRCDGTSQYVFHDFLQRVFLFSRYPTNKWIKLGTFHGRDERNVQSFPLDEQMYAKYVKVMFTLMGLCSRRKIYLLLRLYNLTTPA